MIEAIMKIHTTSSSVTFVCGDVAKLSRDEQENLKCLYQHFVLNREDFIDWDI